MTTVDMSGSLRLLSELGFVNGQANALWGDIMELRQLGPEARTLVWWLVGRREYFQLEVFEERTNPGAPLSEDWRASDQGWVRFGVAVESLERSVTGVEGLGIEVRRSPSDREGGARAAFKDPYAGVWIELMEHGTAPGGWRPKHFEAEAAVVYATASVPDLDAYRKLWTETIGFETEPLSVLHDPSDEDLWGLPGAEREGFLARGQDDDVYIEVVSYSHPQPRPRRRDRGLTDQGLAHVCLGLRDPAAAGELIDRLEAAGLEPTVRVGGEELVATYCRDPAGEIEVLGMDAEYDEALGFTPQYGFVATRM